MESNLFSNREIVKLLRSLAAAHLIKNANRFRIIAYENAADSIEHLTREIKDIWQDGRLNTIPNIGSTIAAALDEYFRTGHSGHFERILKGVPETVFELMNISSLGPKRAYKLVKTLKLTNKKTVFEDLRNYCLQGKIAKIPTFGKKSQDAILQAIELYLKKDKSLERRMPLPYASSLAMEIEEYMKKNQHVKRVDSLGSLRRMVTTIGDIDIAVACDKKHSDEIIKHFINFPRKLSVDNAGEKKASIIVSPGIRVDLRVQEERNYGPMLQYFTGSKTHNIKLREYALKRKLSLSEWGIKEIKTKKEKIKEFNNEEMFYNFLDLQYIPPEIREGTNEIDIAKRKQIPNLIEKKDIKGDFHVHSSYDLKPSHDLGVNTYLEICKKAEDLGYQYIGFSDHNPKISDLTKNEIIVIMKKRKEYIEKKLNGKTKTHWFVGLEVDILPSGELALPKEAFEYVDYLLASVHSSFGIGTKLMTQRVLKGLKNPKVKILGHPTGRLLGKREGYEFDWKEVFNQCKARNIAVEINAWPERLDLPDTLVREALDLGVDFMIDTDAHANDHMDNMKYGVAVARRGWATKRDIINTRGLKDLEKWLRS